MSFLRVPQVLETIDVFGFDEMQFFSDYKEAVVHLLNHGKIVITAGLDADFKANVFNGYTDLVALATDVMKLKAVCARCGSFDAVFSQRITEETSLIVIGASNYEARCGKCFNNM